MKSLRFECPIENFSSFRADAVSDDTIFEVLIEAKDARRLRTALMELARVANADKVRRMCLVLEEPTITESRLHQGWKGAASVLRPELFARLSMVIRQSGEWTGKRAFAEAAVSELREPCRQELNSHEPQRRQRTDPRRTLR